MINKAIEKITKEAMELDSPFGFFIEEHLTGICTSDAVAEKLLAEDKSLKQITERIYSRTKEEARKANEGKRYAMWGVKDEAIFKQVDEYYGITGQFESKTSKPADKVDVLDLF